MAATPQETIIEDEIREATQLLDEITAKVDTMTKEEKEEQLCSIWDSMKYLIDEETGKINETAREIYEEIIELLDQDFQEHSSESAIETPGMIHTDEEPQEILTALRVNDYIFLNAKKMVQMDLEEWAARLHNLIREQTNAEAHSLLTEAMLNVAYYLDNYSSNNPVAEDHTEETCDHGKEEAEEDAREEEERIERVIEYNHWFLDGRYKEVAY
jgi:hypothetical protein